MMVPVTREDTHRIIVPRSGPNPVTMRDDSSEKR